MGNAPLGISVPRNLPTPGMQLSATGAPLAPVTTAMMPEPQPTPQMRPRSLGAGAATFPMPSGAMLRKPDEAGYPGRVAPLVRRADAPGAAPTPLIRRQSDQSAPTSVQSKLTVMQSPRMTTRPEAGMSDVKVQSPNNGVHPARSTLHICRPSTGSVTVRPTPGGGVSGDMSQRVRTSSPGFRRDQSYRTTLPATLPTNATNAVAAVSPRGVPGPPSKVNGVNQGNRVGRSMPR